MVMVSHSLCCRTNIVAVGKLRALGAFSGAAGILNNSRGIIRVDLKMEMVKCLDFLFLDEVLLATRDSVQEL